MTMEVPERDTTPEKPPATPAHPAAETDDFAEEVIQQRVGVKIRQLRLASGLKAVDLAARAGISQSQLSKIETGKATLSIKILAKLCGALDRPLSYLFQSDREVPRTFGVVGTLLTVEGPESRGVHRFVEEVARLSGERLSFMPLRARQAGLAEEQVAQLREGLIDILIEDAVLFQDLAPALRFLTMPYGFADEAHLQRFLGSEAFHERVGRPLRQAGIRLLNPRWNWRRGVERVLASTRPVMEPADAKGLRVRVSEPLVQAPVWRALGAEPVVLPWTEVKAALAHGEIDAVATHKAHLLPLGFCRHARYVTLLGDVPAVLAVGVNDAKFQALPPELQASLSAACDGAGEAFTAIVAEAERENEPLNVARHHAVYLRVPLAPWRAGVAEARRRLIAQGVLPADTWRVIESLKRADRS